MVGPQLLELTDIIDPTAILREPFTTALGITICAEELQQYTQDMAVIEVEASKINPANFPGNFIDLGTKYTPIELTRKMQPNPMNSRNFTWPGTAANRLLKLFGTIPKEEMRNPQMFDQDGEACITVRVEGSRFTHSQATTFNSYTCKYFSEGDTAISKEWAVIPLDKESGPFFRQRRFRLCRSRWLGTHSWYPHQWWRGPR
jgi:hypothetical protein